MTPRRSKLPRANGLALRLAEYDDYDAPRPVTITAEEAKRRLITALQDEGRLAPRKDARGLH